MPVYEYFCPQCNTKFEMLRSLNMATVDADCPKCGGKAERILSPCALRAASLSTSLASTGGSSSCASCSSTTCSSCR
jgi:putative FmdB family regulatory protein